MPTVHVSSVIDAPIEKVWARIRDFNGLPSWHPRMIESEIEGSEEPLTAVACNLGFTTQANFTRFFRDHAGVPPTLYREAARTAA